MLVNGLSVCNEYLLFQSTLGSGIVRKGKTRQHAQANRYHVKNNSTLRSSLLSYVHSMQQREKTFVLCESNKTN